MFYFYVEILYIHIHIPFIFCLIPVIGFFWIKQANIYFKIITHTGIIDVIMIKHMNHTFTIYIHTYCGSILCESVRIHNTSTWYNTNTNYTSISVHILYAEREADIIVRGRKTGIMFCGFLFLSVYKGYTLMHPIQNVYNLVLYSDYCMRDAIMKFIYVPSSMYTYNICKFFRVFVFLPFYVIPNVGYRLTT